VTIDLEAAFDTYLQILASTGSIVAQDDDSGEGTNSRVTFIPQGGLSYTVRASSFGSLALGDYYITTQPYSLGYSGEADNAGGFVIASHFVLAGDADAAAALEISRALIAGDSGGEIPPPPFNVYPSWRRPWRIIKSN